MRGAEADDPGCFHWPAGADLGGDFAGGLYAARQKLPG